MLIRLSQEAAEAMVDPSMRRSTLQATMVVGYICIPMQTARHPAPRPPTNVAGALLTQPDKHVTRISWMPSGVMARGQFWKGRANAYSTVTDFAKLRGWSTSVPFRTATWYASSCNGIVKTMGAIASSVGATLKTFTLGLSSTSASASAKT